MVDGSIYTHYWEWKWRGTSYSSTENRVVNTPWMEDGTRSDPKCLPVFPHRLGAWPRPAARAAVGAVCFHHLVEDPPWSARSREFAWDQDSPRRTITSSKRKSNKRLQIAESSGEARKRSRQSRYERFLEQQATPGQLPWFGWKSKDDNYCSEGSTQPIQSSWWTLLERVHKTLAAQLIYFKWQLWN